MVETFHPESDDGAGGGCLQQQNPVSHRHSIQFANRTAIWLALWISAGLSFSGPPAPAQESTAASLRSEGLEQFRAGRLDAALASFSKAIEQEPDTALNWTGRAVVRAWKDGRRLKEMDDEREYEAIAAAIEKDYLAALGIAEDPVAEYQDWAGPNGRREAAVLIGVVEVMASTDSTMALLAMDTEDWEAGLARLGRAIGLLPDAPFFYWERAFFLFRKGRVEEAIRDCNEIERIARLPRIGYRAGDPEGLAAEDAGRQGIYGNALELRGSAYRAQNELSKSLADLNAAIQIQPSATAHFERGTTFLMQNDFQRASADFEEAVRLDPKNHQAYGNLSMACLLGKAYDRALEAANTAIRLAPDQAGHHGARGAIRLEMGQPDEAIADLTEALRLAPQLGDAFHYRGRAYLMKEDWDRAIGDFGESIRLTPARAEAFQFRGVALARKGDVAAAQDDWAALRRLAPRMPAVLRAIPVSGASGVDPKTSEIVVVFDREMRTDGWTTSPVGTVPIPPMPKESPARFRDGVTFVIDVALEPDSEYALGFNTRDFPNFQSAEGFVPAVPFVLRFKTGAASPPVVVNDEGPRVVKTSPAGGASDIEAGTIDLLIEFDKPMKQTDAEVEVLSGAWKAIGKAKWIDSRTWSLPLLLAPGTDYQIGVNTGAERTFVSAGGVPAVRFELRFCTENLSNPP